VGEAIVDRAREREVSVLDVSAGRSSLEEVFKGLLRSENAREDER